MSAERKGSEFSAKTWQKKQIKEMCSSSMSLKGPVYPAQLCESTLCDMKGFFMALGSCGPLCGAKLSSFCNTILLRIFSIFALWLGVLWLFVWHTNFDGLKFDFGNRCVHFLFRKSGKDQSVEQE